MSAHTLELILPMGIDEHWGFRMVFTARELLSNLSEWMCAAERGA